jgi:hypothetical protein
MGLVILEPNDCLGFIKSEEELEDLLVVEVAHVEDINLLAGLLFV